MSLRPIVITGEPLLHRRAKPVEIFDPALSNLVDDLFETMDAAPGVGLAAPQIGVDARVFVYGWTAPSGEDYRGVAVNPTLWITPAPIGPESEESEAEGCLSVPGYRFPLHRGERAQITASDVHGDKYSSGATGWLARIWQHEYDHLNGILYVDRLQEPYARRAAKAIRHDRWGVPGLSWMPGDDEADA